MSARLDLRALSALVLLVACTVGVGPFASSAAAADRRAPRIVGASMQDVDGDDKADRLVLTYNERIKHRADRDGRYPFKLTGPTYGIRRINGAKGTKKLVILLKEKAAPDPTGRPDVGYVRGKPQPVKDMAGNEARRQTFTLTVPLPCEANASTDFYANPVVARTATPAPTGVSSPPWCAFRTLTSAMSALRAKGGGRVIAIGAGTDPAVFPEEAFPITVPSGAMLTTGDDPALGGSGLDPTRYLVRFPGTGSTAVDLAGGTIRGMTFSNAGGDATQMVACEASGSVMTAVTLDGSGGGMTRGLMLHDRCVLTDGLSASSLDAGQGIRVRGFEGPGVQVANGAEVSLFWSKVHHNDGDGFWIRGAASLTLGEVAFNGDDGVFVDQAEPSSFLGLRVRDNASNGFEIHSSAISSFYANQIFNNARPQGSPGGMLPQLLFTGPTPAGSGVYVQTATDCVEAYPIGYAHVDECTPDGSPPTGEPDVCLSGLHNAIFGYDTLDPSPNSVGIRAINDSYVQADHNEWASSTSSQNVSQGAGSFVKAEMTCGTRVNPGDTSGDPVD